MQRVMGFCLHLASLPPQGKPTLVSRAVRFTDISRLLGPVMDYVELPHWPNPTVWSPSWNKVSVKRELRMHILLNSTASSELMIIGHCSELLGPFKT